MQIKTDIVKKLFPIFRECFDHKLKLNKIITSQTFIIGYTVFQNIASIIAAINKNKLNTFYNNDNSATLTLCKFPNKNNFNVKDNTCIDTEVVYKTIVNTNGKIYR